VGYNPVEICGQSIAYRVSLRICAARVIEVRTICYKTKSPELSGGIKQTPDELMSPTSDSSKLL
jgi:hypothetical protein